MGFTGLVKFYDCVVDSYRGFKRARAAVRTGAGLRRAPFWWRRIRSPSRSTRSCRRASAASAATRLPPYAEAVANGEMINKCAPGGEQVMLKLAELLNVEPQPLGSRTAAEPERKVAYIDEGPTASAAPSAFRPARWTPSSAPPAPCTPSSPTSAPAATCASPCPTDCIEMRTGRHHRRQLEVGHEDDPGASDHVEQHA